MKQIPILDGTKIAWHREKAMALLRGERVMPTTIDMALGKNCNFKCGYCYSNRFQKNKVEPLTQGILYRFLDDCKYVGVKAISLVSDSESTCHPEFGNFLMYAHRNGIDTAVGTNGSLLHRFDMNAIIPTLTYLRVNISAGEEKRYCEIHGVKQKQWLDTLQNIRTAVEIKKRILFGRYAGNQDLQIGLQMVLMYEYSDQILPLAKLGKELGVDFLVIKHVSDNERHELGVDYSKYKDLEETLKEAEAMSTENYFVKVKWSKITNGGLKNYNSCISPSIILQISGNGGIFPCGFLFTRDEFCAGNIAKTSFKKILQSEKYWKIMERLRNPKLFNVHTQCGCNCLQHLTNEVLWKVKQGKMKLEIPKDELPPLGINFI